MLLWQAGEDAPWFIKPQLVVVVVSYIYHRWASRSRINRIHVVPGRRGRSSDLPSRCTTNFQLTWIESTCMHLERIHQGLPTSCTLSLKACIHTWKDTMCHVFTKQLCIKFSHSKQLQFLFLFCIIWLTRIASACIRRGCKPVMHPAAVLLVVASYCLVNRISISMHYERM